MVMGTADAIRGKCWFLDSDSMDPRRKSALAHSPPFMVKKTKSVL